MLAHDARLLDRHAVRFDRAEPAAGGRAPVEHEVDRLAAHGHAELELAGELFYRRRDGDAQVVAHVRVALRSPASELVRDAGLERRGGSGLPHYRRGDEERTGDAPRHFASARNHGSIRSAMTAATRAKITGRRAGHGPRKSTIVGTSGLPGPRKP